MKRKTLIAILYVVLSGLIFFTGAIIYALAARQKTILGQSPTTDTALMLLVFIAIISSSITNLKKSKK
jgi:hypothetical protein